MGIDMTFPTSERKTFDIHLASDVLSSRLEARLKSMGFSRDAFIGGTTGVVHPQHFSNRPSSIGELRMTWNQAVALLSQTSRFEFCGYAEAEITPPRYRAKFDWKPFDRSVPLPLKAFEYESCPINRYKDVDIHLTADLNSIDPDLQRVLEDQMNFHFVDIRRACGSVVRVYTVQPLGITDVGKLYIKVADYIWAAGGLEGKIKLEATYRFARFPSDASVCPVITKIPDAYEHSL